MRAKRDSFFAHSAQLIQAEYLKSTRVRQDGAPPRHELVQPAHPANRLDTGPEIQVVGITQYDLRAQLFENVLRHSLDRRHRSHRHEYRSFAFAMWRGHPPKARSATGSFKVKRKRHVLGIVAIANDRPSPLATTTPGAPDASSAGDALQLAARDRGTRPADEGFRSTRGLHTLRRTMSASIFPSRIVTRATLSGNVNLLGPALPGLR